MVLGIKANRSLLVIAFLFSLCSCGSRRSLQISYARPVLISENGRVTLEPTPVAVQTASPQQELTQNAQTPTYSAEKTQENTWLSNIQIRLDSLCRLPLFETTQLGLYVFDLTDNVPV